jgi:hypothetical protein
MAPMSAAASKLAPKSRVLHCDERFAMSQVGDVCIGIWRKKPTLASFNAQRDLLTQAVVSGADGAGYICIIESSAEPPDDEIRRASARMVTSQGTKLKRVACVIEGSGFQAAITRSVLSGILRFIRTPSPIKLFASAPVAAAWMEVGTNPGPLPELEQHIEALRKRLPDNP